MDQAVANYLEKLSERRRRDAETLAGLMARVTAEEPRMWGSIVGFGSYHYRYASGREGDAPAAGLAARKAATTIYLADGIAAHEDLLRVSGRTPLAWAGSTSRPWRTWTSRYSRRSSVGRTRR